MKISIRNVLLGVLVVMLWLLPAVVFAQRRYVDPFLWTQLSDVAFTEKTGSFRSTYADSFAYSALLYSVSAIAGIDPGTLSFVPIGSIATPLLGLVITRRLVTSSLFAVLFSLYLAFDFTLSSSQYSSFAYAWLHPLFLTFLLVLVLYAGFARAEHTTVGQAKRGSRRFLLLLITIFFTVYYFHPTYTFWILTLTGGLAVTVAITRKLGSLGLQVKNVTALAVCFGVIYLGFNELFYRTIIKKALSADPEMIPEQSLTMMRYLLGSKVTSLEPYSATPAPPTLSIGYAISIRTALIICFLAAVIIVWVIKNRGGFVRSINSDVILVVGLLGVGISHTIGYALYGHLSIRFVVLAFPLAVLLAAKTMGMKRVALFFAVALLVLAVAQTTSYAIQVPIREGALEQTAFSTAWLTSHNLDRISILGDFESSQTMSFHFQHEGRVIKQQFFDSQIYGDVVQGNRVPDTIMYLVVNKQEPVTLSSGWHAYEPLFRYSGQLDSNRFISKTYDDGTIWIYDTQ